MPKKLHLGVFQPLGKETIPHGIVILAHFLAWDHKSTERLFLLCPQVKAVSANSEDIWTSRYDGMNSSSFNFLTRK